MKPFGPILRSGTTRRSWILLLLVLAYPLAGFAAEAPAGEIDWLRLFMGLFGGLALFLFGMDVMTHALKSAAGDYIKDILARMTRNRFVGVGMGAFVTAIIQSSSVTTVIMVGFISAGLMTMSQSVAVIIGANIGTTITVLLGAIGGVQAKQRVG